MVYTAKRLPGLPPYSARYQQIYDEIGRGSVCRILEIGTNDGLNARRMVAAASGCPEVRYMGLDLYEHQSSAASSHCAHARATRSGGISSATRA